MMRPPSDIDHHPAPDEPSGSQEGYERRLAGYEVIPERGLSAPLWGWAVLITVSMGLLGSASAAIRSESTTIATLSRSVAAFEIIEKDGVTTKEIGADELPSGAIENPAELEGRYATRELKAQSSVTQADVVDGEALEGVKLELQPDKASLVDVEAGDRMELRLAPTGDLPELEPVLVDAYLIAADEEDGSFIVTVDEEEVDEVMRLAARSAIFLSPAE